MTTELNVLKQISENKGEAPIQLIAKQLKIGNDYTRYLCKELLKKGLMKKLEKKDWYKITLKGEEKIGEREEPLGKPAFKKHISRKKTIERKIQKDVDIITKVFLEKAKKGREVTGSSMEKMVKRVLERMDVPTRKEFEELKKTVSELKKKLRKKMGKPMKRKAIKRAKRIEVKIQKKSKPPEEKFQKIIKIFKEIFRIKKD